MNLSFEEVFKLAEQLDSAQQNLLIYRLRLKQMKDQSTSEKPQTIPMHEYNLDWPVKRGSEYIESYRSPTREELIQDAEILRDIPVRPDSSLLGKYANPNVPQMSEEEFHAHMHAIATDWEQELDDLADDND